MIRFNAFLGLALLCSPILAAAQANISNGTVRIGVRADGALMPSVAPSTGITYLPTGADGLTPGCLCEAWGIADATSSRSGFTGSNVGSSGITTESFVSNATSATSVTNAFGTFRVTHSFNPSSVTADLFEVKVTIQNISAASTRVLYGRAVDWDIAPTPFNELVTLQRGTSTALVYSSDDGFYNADPLGTDNPNLFSNQDVVDSGPTDHGAHFRFNLGTLAPGASLEFTIGYGAAASTAAATTALTAFRAEAYSLGEPSSSSDGSPNTYMLAFRGVRGTPIFETFTTCAAEGITGTKLTLCRQICEVDQSPTRLAGLIKLYMGAFRSEPPCAR